MIDITPYSPCQEGLDFLKGKSLDEAYANCHSIEWIAFYIGCLQNDQTLMKEYLKVLVRIIGAYSMGAIFEENIRVLRHLSQGGVTLSQALGMLKINGEPVEADLFPAALFDLTREFVTHVTIMSFGEIYANTGKHEWLIRLNQISNKTADEFKEFVPTP